MARRQSATTIVSFALIAPVFFFLVFAISEGARVFNAWVIITNEAREAARYGAVHYDSTQTVAGQQTAINQYLSQRLNGSVDFTQLAYTTSVTPGNLSATPPVFPTVDVTVSYRVPIIIPMISAVLGNSFPIRTRSIMVGEPGS
jgi:Flp pilus assembly protein TadG